MKLRRKYFGRVFDSVKLYAKAARDLSTEFMLIL